MKINKFEITVGVYWVEVPQLDVRILCATPSDSVKHMMKTGLIRNIEQNGVTFESGPNHILLSDKMIQNSQFSNLGEFPVLQMLYKQGMILPNHPGNTGIKPTIMGSREQVDIQMEYIYRGNYGLTSIDELLDAGATEQQAKEIMDIKLKFAFGKLKKSDELLNKLYIDDENVSIKDEFYVRRKGINIFEFSFEDEVVEVDLNLKKEQFYTPTYHLGLTNFKREYFSVIHTGEGDGWDIKRPCMGSIVTFQGRIYLIDAGPNIDATLNALGISVNEIEGIFHTHAHDDHFAGITSLIQSDHKLKYYSSSIVRDSVLTKLSILLSIDKERLGSFFEFYDLELDTWNNINGLEVKPILSPHPVETNIMYFRVLGESEYRSYGHLADICSFSVLDSLLCKDDAILREVCERTKEAYLEPVDVKKIDNGGGMIHGVGEDFIYDKSTKLMLSHSSQPLSTRLKQIGSGAPFGSIDILISGQQDYNYEYANNYLKSYFPNVPKYWIKMILNNDIKLFNPETIIIKDGMQNEHVYLIITGNVDMIQTNENVYNVLSSGAIIGDFSGIHELESNQTFRAASYVSALAIPSSQYFHFIQNNHLYKDLEKLYDRRSFLEKTWLFGESISYAQLNIITHNLKIDKYSQGELIDQSVNKGLKLIKSGSVINKINDEEIRTLSFGDFFNENSVLYDNESIYEVYALEDCEIVTVDLSILQDIPIIIWKLYITYENRTKELLSTTLGKETLFIWNDGYSINVEDIDEQHIALFDITNRILRAINKGFNSLVLKEMLNQYSVALKLHCKNEESILQKHGYSNLAEHKKAHDTLIKKVKAYNKKIEQMNYHEKKELVEFLKNWLLEHILIEDKKYSKWIKQNHKG